MIDPMNNMRAEMALAPVFDARGELQSLVGILGAVIYLAAPRGPEEETEKDGILTALIAVQEKLADLADGLNDAITNMTIKKDGIA